MDKYKKYNRIKMTNYNKNRSSLLNTQENIFLETLPNNNTVEIKEFPSIVERIQGKQAIRKGLIRAPITDITDRRENHRFMHPNSCF